MTPFARRGAFLFLAALILLLGAFAFDYWRAEGGAAGDGAGGFAGLSLGGPFTLVDQNGVTRHDTDFHGKLMLVYFGYTYCPDACPTALQTMSAAMDKLGDRAASVVPIFITVDPARDTVAQMKLYAANFTPHLVALTGSEQQTTAAARAYRVYFQKVKGDRDDDYLVDHSSFILLMGRDGKYLTHFGPNVTADSMAAAIGKYL